MANPTPTTEHMVVVVKMKRIRKKLNRRLPVRGTTAGGHLTTTATTATATATAAATSNTSTATPTLLPKPLKKHFIFQVLFLFFHRGGCGGSGSGGGDVVDSALHVPSVLSSFPFLSYGSVHPNFFLLFFNASASSSHPLHLWGNPRRYRECRIPPHPHSPLLLLLLPLLLFGMLDLSEKSVFCLGCRAKYGGFQQDGGGPSSFPTHPRDNVMSSKTLLHLLFYLFLFLLFLLLPPRRARGLLCPPPLRATRMTTTSTIRIHTGTQRSSTSRKKRYGRGRQR